MTRLSHIAAQSLQRQIHDGTYAKGAALPGQRELASQLGISRTALREAIFTLEALGMVRSYPGKGVYVTAGAARSEAELPTGPLAAAPHAVFQFRAIVEPAAAALAAQHADAGQKARLHEIQEAMESALKSLDLVAASEADLAFHLAIADFTHNPMLAQAIRSLEEPIAYSLRLPFADPLGIWAPADEHRAVVAAINAQSPSAAHEAMTHHLIHAAARIGFAFDLPYSPGAHHAGVSL